MIQLRLNRDLTLSKPENPKKPDIIYSSLHFDCSLKGCKADANGAYQLLTSYPIANEEQLIICQGSKGHSGSQCLVKIITIERQEGISIKIRILLGHMTLLAITTMTAFYKCEARIGSEYQLVAKRVICFDPEVTVNILKIVAI